MPKKCGTCRGDKRRYDLDPPADDPDWEYPLCETCDGSGWVETPPPAKSPIAPEWRTTTVCQLCQTIRQSKDYGILPILADALQDAGCDDGAMLDALRSGDVAGDVIEAQRLLALVFGEESAEAVRWVEEVASGMGVTDPDYPGGRWDFELQTFVEEPRTRQPVQPDYRFVMEAAAAWLESGGRDYTTQMGSEDWRDDFPFAAFWAKYVLITGAEPDWSKVEWPGDVRGQFFSCSC